MKTTIEIADALFADARATAEREGITFRALVEEGLREAVRRRGQKKPFKLKDASVTGQGLNPDYDTWEKVMDACYEGRSG